MHYTDDTPELGNFVVPYPKNPPHKIVSTNYTGKLIVLEGLDGSGKSTQTKMLADSLLSSGKSVHVANFIHSDLIKVPLLKTKWLNSDPYTATLLYAMALTELFHTRIISHLHAGSFVILDRYVSTIWAKGFVRGISQEWLTAVTAHLVPADVTIFVDTSPKACLERKLSISDRLSYWECGGDILGDDHSVRHSYDKDYFSRLFLEYQALIRNYFINTSEIPFIYIDGSQAKDTVHRKIMDIVLAKTENRW